MDKYYICESVRLCRYLYSLGFSKKSVFQNGTEKWLLRNPIASKKRWISFLVCGS